MLEELCWKIEERTGMHVSPLAIKLVIALGVAVVVLVVVVGARGVSEKAKERPFDPTAPSHEAGPPQR